MSFIVRKGEVGDMPIVLELLEEYAVIKKQEAEFKLTIYDLIRDGFSVNSLFEIFIAEFDENIIGFLMYSQTYSNKGRSLVLEDAYVSESYTKLGIGTSLFSKFIEYAYENDIEKIEWKILERFKDFVALHQRSGAKILFDAHIYELGIKEIKKNSSLVIKSNLEKPKIDFEIRKGKLEDMSGVLECMQAFANYKNVICEVDIYDLMKDGFSDNPYFNTFICVVNDEVVGALLFFENYSTLKGKSITIEDLYVKPDFRKNGISSALNKELYKFAYKHNVKYVSQVIFDWDESGKRMCEYYGAKKIEGTRISRVTKKILQNFINKR